MCRKSMTQMQESDSASRQTSAFNFPDISHNPMETPHASVQKAASNKLKTVNKRLLRPEDSLRCDPHSVDTKVPRAHSFESSRPFFADLIPSLVLRPVFYYMYCLGNVCLGLWPSSLRFELRC